MKMHVIKTIAFTLAFFLFSAALSKESSAWAPFAWAIYGYANFLSVGGGLNDTRKSNYDS